MTDELHAIYRWRRVAQTRMAQEGADVEALAYLLYILDCAASKRWRARLAQPPAAAEPWEDRMLRVVPT